jgi:TonB family protein
MPIIDAGVDPTMMRAPAVSSVGSVAGSIAAVSGPTSAIATSVTPKPVVESRVIVDSQARRSTGIASNEPLPNPDLSGAGRSQATGSSMYQGGSRSMAASPRRGFGKFLVALLLFDAGLALAGGLMLRSALARTAPPVATVVPARTTIVPESSVPTPVPASSTPAAATTPTAPKPAPVAQRAAATGAMPSLGTAAINNSSSVPPAQVDHSTKRPGSTGPTPVDPYAHGTPTAMPTPSVGSNEAPVVAPLPQDTPLPPNPSEQTAQEESLADQVRRQEVRAKSRFNRCYSTAAKAVNQPLNGTITVAFQVTPQGKVTNSAVVDNGTGSDSLGRCVAAEVSKWSFQSDSPAVQDFVRVFRFEGQ